MKIQQQWLSVPEVAKHFGVNSRTITRWMQTGQIAYMRVGTGNPRISRAMIQEFVQNNEVQRAQVEQECVTA